MGFGHYARLRSWTIDCRSRGTVRGTARFYDADQQARLWGISAGLGHRSPRLVVALSDLPSWSRITGGHGDAQARDKIVNLHMIHTLCADRRHVP